MTSPENVVTRGILHSTEEFKVELEEKDGIRGSPASKYPLLLSVGVCMSDRIELFLVVFTVQCFNYSTGGTNERQ